MTDNITVKDHDSNDVILATRESAGVHTPKHYIADADHVTFGAKADPAWSGTGDATLIAIEKAIYTKAEAVRALLTGTLTVAVSGTPAVTISGTPAVTLSGTGAVGGNVASGAADSGNPVKVGGVFNTTKPTIANAQRGDLQIGTRGSLCVQIMAADNASPITSTTSGSDARSTGDIGLTSHARQFNFNGSSWDQQRGDTNGVVTQPHAMASSRWSYAAAAAGITTATAVTLMSAGGAGVRNYLTAMQITAEALGTATEIVVRDGAGGTVLWRSKIGTAGWPNGREIDFAAPLRGSPATALVLEVLTAPGGGAIYSNAQGFQGP